MPDPGLIYRAAAQHRAALLRLERDAASAMVREYGRTWINVQQRLAGFLAQLAALQRAGTPPPPSWLYERDRMTVLLRDMEMQLAQFARYAESAVTQQQAQAVRLAEEHVQRSVALAFEQTGLVGCFAKLNVGAYENIVGFTESGPLRKLLDTLGPQISQGFRDNLIDGIALGRNPREITRLLRKQYSVGLHRALRINRTEMLRAYRETTHLDYLENDDILSGWIWVAAHSARTCAMCLAMDGSLHRLSERLDDHPNGRCVAAPTVRGAKRPEYERGVDWFAKQDEETQRRVLGGPAFAAFKAGKVDLRDFVGRRRSVEWGTTRYAKSLKAIVGTSDARKWREEFANGVLK